MTAVATLSRESRWLRLGGMALLGVAVGVIAFFDDATDAHRFLAPRGIRDQLKLAFVSFAGANVFALGLILLLAGLRELSLLKNDGARRGALVRIGAVNLIVPCLIVATIADADAFSDVTQSEWFIAPMMVAFLVVARVSIKLFRTGWKHEARTAEQVRAADPRAPVVYLRSFAADDQILETTGMRGARVRGLFMYTASVSSEQEMAFIMERVGPVIAIGRPGERLPELGAARLYVGDHEWRDVVGQLMSDAALVVIRAGDTPNLWWEIDQVMRRCAPERVLIMALGPPTTLAPFERRFVETFGAPASATAPAVPSRFFTIAMRLFLLPGFNLGKIIYFDGNGRPYEQPVSPRLSGPGLILLPYRPYRDSLQSAFKAVFARLGLPWSAKRTLTTAVLLALCGGMIGLHQFYMGRRRRALWYLAFAWSGFPIVLGWIDAVRLALLTEAQFQARLRTPSGGESRVSEAA